MGYRELEDRTPSADEGEFERYAASWVDRLTARISRLPGSSWVYYLGLLVVIILIQVLVLWIEGLFPSHGVDTAQLFFAVAIPYMLALIYYFDRRAKSDLAGMRPAIITGDSKFEELEFRLTTLPFWATILAGLLGISCIFMIEAITGEPYYLETVVTSPISAILFRILYFILWGIFGTFIFHVIHQLRMIDHIYTNYIQINLFQMKTLYAFSNLTAITAVCVALLPIGFLLTNPWVPWNDPVVFSVVISVQIIALATFIWPLLGIHRLQVAEKERLLEEANQHFEAMIAKLHRNVDSGELEHASSVSTTISSLQVELNTIEDIPTWPWRPETLRLLISALALPLGLWFVQMLLQRLLVP